MDGARLLGAFHVLEQQIEPLLALAQQVADGGVAQERLWVDRVVGSDGEVVAAAVDRVARLDDYGPAIASKPQAPDHALPQGFASSLFLIRK